MNMIDNTNKIHILLHTPTNNDKAENIYFIMNKSNSKVSNRDEYISSSSEFPESI